MEVKEPLTVQQAGPEWRRQPASSRSATTAANRFSPEASPDPARQP